jgi:hypothetical protein
VTVYTGRVELGQGNTTALAQIVPTSWSHTRAGTIPVDTRRRTKARRKAATDRSGRFGARAAAAEARAIALKRAGERLSTGRYADRQ